MSVWIDLSNLAAELRAYELDRKFYWENSGCEPKDVIEVSMRIRTWKLLLV